MHVGQAVLLASRLPAGFSQPPERGVHPKAGWKPARRPEARPTSQLWLLLISMTSVRGGIVRVGRHDIKITRPEKVLFPADAITKAELIDYYLRVAPWILPHLRGRPLAMERYPNGIDKTRVFQKAVSSYYPEWIRTVTVKKFGGTVKHVVCDNEATLAYIANQACITPHIWLSQSDELHHPDQ